LVSGAELAFFGGGSKYYEKVGNTSKVAYTVMFFAAADGTMGKPMVIFKSLSGILYDTWIPEDGPEGATYAASASGWMDMVRFNQWFKLVFLEHIKQFPKQEPKVLIGDNLASHLSPYVLELCEEWNVRFVFLPENSTHILQPLDVGVFGPMKRAWKTVLSTWKVDCEKTGKFYPTIPKAEFPRLLRKMLEGKDFKVGS